tara:strand:- start:39 stop:524 length:486 start_codon:yes stop_codon:yes gene_type:complete
MNSFNNLINNDNYNNNLFNLNSFEFYEFNELLNKTNILIDKSSIVIDKVNLILEEWLKYNLLNKSSELIYDLNKLILETSFIVNLSSETFYIYNNIGNFILTNISFMFYLIIISSILGICIQIFICIFLYFIYRNSENIIEFKKLKIKSRNEKNKYSTYYV